MEILDSHFHIHSMAKRGVDTTLPLSLIGIEVGTEPGDFEKRKPLIPHGIDYSHAAGPWCVQGEDYEGEEKASARVRNDFLLHGGTFLGEIGLDYHWMYGTKEKQIALFESQLDLAEELNLPVIHGGYHIKKKLPLLWNHALLLIRCENDGESTLKQPLHIVFRECDI